MNLVVSFLSMLGTEEENGGVKRMLGVCSEFERIAKVVLDKAEKETSSRKKRKSHEDPTAKASHIRKSTIPQMPMATNAQTPSMVFSPSMVNPLNLQNGYNPLDGNGSSPVNAWSDYGAADGGDFLSPNGMTPFTDIPGYTNGSNDNSPLNPNTFQQPFVPQDLWQMPMTLEWDWADMTGGAYPSFENGMVGDPNVPLNNSHLR
jgi:hypothetical protein